jgi:hypothetical protein
MTRINNRYISTFVKLNVILLLFVGCELNVTETPENTVGIAIDKYEPEISQDTGDKYICFRDFSQVHSDETIIDFKEIPLQPKFIRNENSGMAGIEKSVWSLNQEYGIVHWVNPATNELITESDSLELLGEHINNIPPYPSMMKAAFYFNHKEKKYILLMYEHFGCMGVRNYFYHEVLLIDATVKNKFKSYRLGQCDWGCTCGRILRMHPNYIGDFNKDGNLDYIAWNLDERASVYSLENDTFILNNDYYLVLDHFDIPEPWNNENHAPRCSLNLNKSRWYYPIEEVSSEVSCDIDMKIKYTYNVEEVFYEEHSMYKK